MASRTSRKEWVRGLPWAFGVARQDCKRVHWASERSVGYGFLIGESVRNHPNPHLYQTGSKGAKKPSVVRKVGRAPFLRACLVRVRVKPFWRSLTYAEDPSEGSL